MTISFANRVRARIHGAKNNSVQENLVNGVYLIMRKLKGYTHFDFLHEDFTAAQYFLLIELISDELAQEQKRLKKTDLKK